MTPLSPCKQRWVIISRHRSATDGKWQLQGLFYTQQAIVTEATRSQDGVQCIPTLSELCLPPRHPNSLWHSYRPRVHGWPRH